MEKLIITVAPTGAWPTKENTPYVPLTPEEIADEVYRSWKAGAAIAHIHVRDDKGKPSMEFEKFERTVKLIRERCDIIINLTTSGGLDVTDEDRMKPFIELKPELASFDAGSMNWMNTAVFLNPPKFLETLARKMKENNVKPEIEVFDTGMIYNALYIAQKGLIDKPYHFQFVLGAPGGITATHKNLLHLVESIPEGSTWSVVGIGKYQLPMIYTALSMGGHIRVGMEDNVYLAKGVLAKSNADFVEKVVRLAKEFGREIATSDEARKILCLKCH
ncbi:MAG: 3-keto-5-aminohexanoate cleavage enzyme [Thermosediminibacterales bacterium]|nr:3-keto-5-aminohexanoate cleavage enzyme [Thermosediminibacterales bacterium]